MEMDANSSTVVVAAIISVFRFRFFNFGTWVNYRFVSFCEITNTNKTQKTAGNFTLERAAFGPQLVGFETL